MLFKIGVWMCFAALILYTILYGRNEEKMDGKVFLIRKIWYLFYILGALIYWTQYPESIFTEWKNYLIVVIIFFGVDAFIFLNMYLKRAGDYELDRFTNTVSANENLIQDHLSMTKNMVHTLNNEGIIGYYGTKEAYLLGLRDVLESYAKKEDMTVNLLPFTTLSEKEQALLSFANPDSIRAKLDREETVYNTKEMYALHPVYLFDNELYVLKITGKRPISEMDCLLFVVMIHIYDLAVPEDH
ncbi:type II toxin-antitoxin system SpoIISA family toxin [Pullulanibacillus sp. KACC 23026]|uniref:type II toxin-antitoxin system SpoIISA family toxin n=1 Tax=Pullulanibacillus sp. KACC 23026 TaxID=3028315 RepID=UPI0023B10550|nr:type II toxin-antitoxin system SpoIISA family toxin [Pullulanibacillus sp. KACC 23026]WEG14957.1 type II toxin-antitoxin system SpoIISA family toxin [Pullulanibacillus sp. KACC 23026]